jgi:hypothetical protein
MINGKSVLNEMARLIQRIFNLRASSASYPVIAIKVARA